jgi:hypothetical protein
MAGGHRGSPWGGAGAEVVHRLPGGGQPLGGASRGARIAPSVTVEETIGVSPPGRARLAQTLPRNRLPPRGPRSAPRGSASGAGWMAASPAGLARECPGHRGDAQRREDYGKYG